MALDPVPLRQSQLAAFERDGYAVVRGLFTAGELTELIETFNALHARGEIPGCFAAIPIGEAEDPLDAYPRMMHPHRVSRVAMRYLLHPKLQPILQALLNEPPIAAQSMFYWKPPSARGQALHQDNYYLRVSPGNCLAAWVAVDRAGPENGGLFVVPGSHKLDLFCPEQADLSVSFAGELVPLPEGLAQVPVELDPGDVLFFGGNLIHGSQPNSTPDRFRRSLICHYIGESSEQVSSYYKPLYRFDGAELTIEDASGGGPCGAVQATGPH